MTVTREDLNPCTVKLTVVCEPDEVKEGYEKAYKQIAKNVRLPGFRPGHAPRAMVEPLINSRELDGEAADQIVRRQAKKAMEEQDLKVDPNLRPMVEVTKLDKAAGECEFWLKLGLPAIVELGDYKGLPVEKLDVDVTDEEVDRQLDEIRKRRSTREAITDRGVAEGDVCVVNVKLDGDGEARTFMTVAGQTFAGLDEVLMGMKVEEMKHAELEFPENFQEKDWAGKTLKCVVTVSSISAVKMPELDEEFAKSLQSDNVDELRSRLRDAIKRAKEEGMREIVNESLLDRLLERSKVEVADNMWENLANQRLRELAQEQQRQGKTLEDHAKANGMTIEEWVDNWRDNAKLSVKRALIIREVFAKEKMTYNERDLNQELNAMAGEYDMSQEDLINILKKNNQLEELTFRAIARKVGDFLSENAEAKEAVGA